MGYIFRKPKEYDFKVYGLDFGYSTDPVAMVEVLKNGNNLYITEMIYETGLTNPMIADKIKKLCSDLSGVYVVVDSAEPKSRDELILSGIPAIACVKGADSVRHGINKLKSFKLHLNKKSLNLQSEFHSYRYAKNRDGSLLANPIDKDNHLMDAARYAITRFKIWV